MDVREEGLGADPLDDAALLVGGLLADGDLHDPAYGEVGHGIEHRLAQDHVTGDVLQLADLLVAGDVDEHRVGVEARTVHRRQELEVEVGLGGRFGQRQDAVHRPAHLHEGDPVPGQGRPYDEAVALDADLAQLLRLAEDLAAADQGPLVGHRHDQRVPALDPAVLRGDGHRAGTEGVAGQVDLADVGPYEGPLGGLERWRQDRRHHVRVALPDRHHTGGPDVGELGALLARRRDLGPGARSVPYACHVSHHPSS